MQFVYALLLSFLAGFATVIGGLVIFFKFKEENIDKFIVGALSFSLAIMIGISITDLIPESTYILLKGYGISKGIIYALLAFIIGVVTIKYLNKVITKLEKKNDLYKLGILNMLVLIMHNFPEGIATFMSTYKDLGLGIKLTLAIAVHNIPEGIAIAVPIYYATSSRKEALFKTFLSGIAEPLGAVIAFFFLSKYINNNLISIILILVGGIMITLAIDVIYPKVQKYKIYNMTFLGIALGLFIAMLSFLLN